MAMRLIDKLLKKYLFFSIYPQSHTIS